MYYVSKYLCVEYLASPSICNKEASKIPELVYSRLLTYIQPFASTFTTWALIDTMTELEEVIFDLVEVDEIPDAMVIELQSQYLMQEINKRWHY